MSDGEPDDAFTVTRDAWPETLSRTLTFPTVSVRSTNTSGRTPNTPPTRRP